MTKPRQKSWREKLAEWADRIDNLIDEVLPGAAVPVPVRPSPPHRPRNR